MPDMETKQPAQRTVNVTSMLDVELRQPNVAKAKAGSEGTWTMVYDEGFYADVDERTFFAFNSFLLSDPDSVDWFEPRVHGKRVYRSVCGRTEVGWYQDKATKQWGCFYGERTDQNPDQHHDYLSFLHVVEDPEYKVPLSFAQHTAVAKEISAKADGWQASAYPRFAGKSVADLNRMAGNVQYTAVGPRSFLETRTVRRERRAVADPAVVKAAAELPETFDWRNVNGTQWVDNVMDQGDCGSCYVVSSTNMLTARHRIATKNPKAPSFSVNFPLYCADLNQGCQGGYPFLTSLWSQGVGLVTQECGGHYHVSSSQQCSAFLENAKMSQKSCMKKEAAVKDFKYVGGYYGACTEEAMMLSLLQGPVTVAIEPAMDFMYYKKGVYRSLSKKKAEEWFKVDHAVMLIGWGVDKSGSEPRKYWLIQNSWGSDWGEDGYVRMARGENESGVEFQALEASVEERDATPLQAFLSEASQATRTV